MPKDDAAVPRLGILAAIIGLAVLVAASDALYERIQQALVFVESLIEASPLLGIVLFVLLAAGSAMLAFFSSAVIVPIGIYAWGSLNCLLLLWLGWLIGGAASYAIGYFFAQPAAKKLVGSQRIARFEHRVGERMGFAHILLFQAALPSEIPGYVLGTARYSFGLYLMALAIVEMPYAVGTVYLGESFIKREIGQFIALSLLAIVLTAGVYALYRWARGRARP